MLALTSYTRVLFLDVDMYPRRPIAALFTTEYAEDFVAFAETSAPYGANLFMVRPSRAAHAAARAASDARAFSVGRGWNGSGLLTWPSLRGSAPCDMPYATRLRGGGACAVWPYWHARCTQLHVSNWNYVSASADNGILWWLFNLSSLTGPTGLTGTYGAPRPLAARVLHRPSTPKGEPEPTASGGWWAHAQSMCKPWLATPKILAGSERCRGIAGWPKCPGSTSEALRNFRSPAVCSGLPSRLAPKGEPSPLGCRREPALALWCPPKVADSSIFGPLGIADYFFCSVWPGMADELRQDCPAFEAARRGVAARLSCPTAVLPV